jgi:predicted porin
MASYQDQNDKNVLNNDNSTWSLGAVVPVGNFGIHLAYAQTDFDSGVTDGKSNGAMVAGTYALSKRTTAYAGYVWTKNDNDSAALSPIGGASWKQRLALRARPTTPSRLACVTRSNTTSATTPRFYSSNGRFGARFFVRVWA